MAEEPENFVLQYLRRIDTKLDRLIEDVQDLKVRMTAVQEGFAGVNRRLDRLDARVERPERRTDLVGGYGGVSE